MRQAQLGASYRVSYSGGVASPSRAKPDQQPVPSDAPVAEPKYLSVNKTGEAFTGNTVGRRGSVLPLSDSAPKKATRAVGDDFNAPEASTYESLW